MPGLMTAYAHSKRAVPPEQWHRLEEHLRGVAEKASRFVSKFSAGTCGWYAGLWHDLGKYAADWQDFLRRAAADADSEASVADGDYARTRRRGPDHSTAGAIHAQRTIADPWLRTALQFAIAGHHGGLANASELRGRLLDEAKIERYRLVCSGAEHALLDAAAEGTLPSFVGVSTDVRQQKRTFELFTRMLFSALVDADYLDTESFLDDDGSRVSARAGLAGLGAYLTALEAYLRDVRATSRATPAVASARDAVQEWCRLAAPGDRGAYSLTVPTGGGKTLASLVFALRHAVLHGLTRVVVVLPFLSILDQTVQVLRKAFCALGDDVVVEHHSNITPEHDTLRNQAAAENWDAPIIVTTQVQLFESLFARRPGDCRKLHNLANSVIILDEVQTLPVGLLDPVLDALQELTANYGVTLLLTTATQPSLHARHLGSLPFRGLSPEPAEIVPSNELDALFERFRRVEVVWPAGPDRTAWDELAKEISAHPQVLAIVHRRADAADLWSAVNALNADAIHLSALMCPAHRRAVLRIIRERLAQGEACRVVSTQLVEAGVDVDFPVVYRAMAGLESLAQSAGRCNREGRLERGRFHVFRAPTDPVSGLKFHHDVAATMLKLDSALDLFAPATFRTYFDRLYAYHDRDARNVQSARESLNYDETSERFRMITDATTTVFIPYGKDGRRAIDAFRFAGPSRQRLRALQAFGVGVYPDGLRALRDRGAVELLHDTVYVLVSASDYDENLGLLVDRQPFEALIA